MGGIKQADVVAQIAEAKCLADVLANHFCQPGQLIFETLRPLHSSERGVGEEVGLALAALRGLGGLQEHLGERVGVVGATMPSRMCFYWLVVWGLLPAAQAEEVALWVPLAIHDKFRVLMQALQCAAHWPTAEDPLKAIKIPSRDSGLSAGGARLGPGGERGKPSGARGESKEILSVDLPYFGSVGWAPDSLAPADYIRKTPMLESGDLLLRQKFFQELGTRFSAVLFDDAPYLAKQAAEYCGDNCLFILRDAGHNPIVLGDVLEGDLPAVARRVVAARVGLFMDDKAGTDAIFVPHDIKDSFVDALRLHLRGSDSLRRIKVVDPCAMEVAMAFASIRSQQRKNKPMFDFAAEEMSPLVTLGDVEDISFIDFRGPVFNVLAYTTPSDLQRYFEAPAYRLQRMWASLLCPGEAAQKSLPAAGVLLNETVAERQDAISSAAFCGQVGSATLRRGQVVYRPVCLAKELKTYAVCEQEASAQVRQNRGVRALRNTFDSSLGMLQAELGAAGWQIAAAWYWGESALDNFLPATPVRCMVVIEPSRLVAHTPAALMVASCIAEAVPANRSLAIRNGNVAARMANHAQLSASSEHRTILAHPAEILQLLAQPPSLLGKEVSSLHLSDSGWQALLTVEALADPTQTFWQPTCSSLATELRGRARAVCATWGREFWAAVRAEGSLLPSSLGSAHLTSLEAHPLVLSNVMRA